MKVILKSQLIIFMLALVSCSTIYYKSWEVLGKEKRELLKENLAKLNEDQEESKQEFKSVLHKIRVEYKIKDDTLSKTYDEMSNDYEDLEEEVEDVGDRISKVESIANDLFYEWKEEANSFDNKGYKQKSMSKLVKTKKSFNSFLKSAKYSHDKANKALRKLKDHVVFIKHNLNAKIIGNLSSELKLLEKEFEQILPSIELSIQKSEGFIHKLN